MLEYWVACTPAFTGFVVKHLGERLASVLFQIDLEERTKRYGTGSVLPTAAADAYEGSGGIRVTGGRSLCVLGRHRYHGQGRDTCGWDTRWR